MTNTQRRVRSVALGFGAGAVISVAPAPLNLLALGILGAVTITSLVRSPTASNLGERPLQAGAALVVMATAILLPVKHLDRQVGPLSYERTTLAELAAALSRDWAVFASVDAQALDRVVSFRTDRRLSRREVLQRLARETGLELHIGYCGTGANLLFGGHPSFTRLTVPGTNDVRPDHPAMPPPARSGDREGQKPR